MSITGVLNTAVTGLMAHQSALSIVSNNIANINTEGYAREVVRRENIVVGGISAGVQITDIERIVDRFLQAAGFDASARSGEAGTEDQFHQRFQGLLGRPDSQTTISARISQLFGVIADLAIDPSGQILRQSVLASMQDLADEINRVSGAIQDLRNETSQQIQDKVSAVNEVLVRIQEINPLIVRQRSVSGESAGLENRRDQALNDLSDLIDIRISRNGDGTIGLTTTSGIVLLDSAVRELEYNAPGVVTSEALFNSIQIWRIDPRSGDRVGTSRDFDHEISSGSLRGLLDLRDNDLRDLSFSLGELSATFIDQVNAIHNAHSAAPAPNQLTGRASAITQIQSTEFTGKTTFAIVDANNQLVQKVTIDFGDPAIVTILDVGLAVNAGLGADGTLSLAGGVMEITATDPTHGVVLIDDPLDPSNRGGRSFSHFFGMNDLLEAAVESSYATGLSAGSGHNLVAGGQTVYEVRDSSGRFLTQYTAPIVGATVGDMFTDLNALSALGAYMTFVLDANGQAVITPQPGFEDLRLAVISDTTDVDGTGVTFTKQFGIGDRYIADAAKNIRIISGILKQPQRFALASMNLGAAIGEVALSDGDQTGALALQALETKVIQFDAAGELSTMSVSLGQYAAAFYSSAGLKAARAKSRAGDQGTLLAEIKTRIADVSGVNLDEELANMVVLQSSFNAAARLITTSQEMFDALLAAV